MSSFEEFFASLGGESALSVLALAEAVALALPVVETLAEADSKADTETKRPESGES